MDMICYRYGSSLASHIFNTFQIYQNSLSDAVDIRPQQYHHLISLIKELGFSNNKLKSELAEYKDMLSDSKAEVTLLNAKLEQLEVSDDSEIESAAGPIKHQNSDNAVVSRLRDEGDDASHGENSRSYSTSAPYDQATTDLMKSQLRVRRSATTLRASDKQTINRLSARTFTAPLYLDPANNLSSSSLSLPSDTTTVVHHHYHYHVHKSKNAFQETGHRRLRKDMIGGDDLTISEEPGQSKSLVPGKSPHTTDISKPVVTSIPSARRKSLLSSSLNDLSKKQQLSNQVRDLNIKSKGSDGLLHSQWSFDDSSNDDAGSRMLPVAPTTADYQRHPSDIMNIPDTGISLCKDAPYHSLHHLGVHFFERLKATDIRALNRQLRRAFDILELSGMSNSIIDNVLADIRVLKSRFLWVEQSIASYKELEDKQGDNSYSHPWESDVSMDDFFPLVELTEILLSEIGEMRITLNDLQVEYVNKVEQIEHQAEKDIRHKRERKVHKPEPGNDSTFSWFTNILARYHTKDFEPTPAHKRHKRTVSHESITSQLMERMEEENQAESKDKEASPKPISTEDDHNKCDREVPKRTTAVDTAPYLSSSLFGLKTDLDAMRDQKSMRKSSATLIPRASRSTGTLRKSQSTRPKESHKSSTLRQYLSTTLSGSLSDYQDDSRPASPDVDWKIANGIGTRRFYK